MKCIRILIFLLLIPILAFGQDDLAMINESDSSVNIRSDKTNDSETIATIKEGEFFLCKPSDEVWWKVVNFHSQTGYIQKSQITLIKNLSDNNQKELIIKTINKLKDYRNKYDSLSLIIPNEERMALLLEFEIFEENVYTPLLPFLSELFCKNMDIKLLNIFLEILIINKMSANELPAWTLGDCYLCHPNLVLNQIDNYLDEDKENLKFLLIFGFENVTWQKEQEIKNYQELKDKLNE